MLRDDTATRYEFGPILARIIPNNPDGGRALPTRVVSDGAGPFDFTDAVDDAAVTISIKTDNGAWVNDTINLSGAGSIAAVTVAELVAAITASAVTNLTASAEAVTGYLKLALTTPGTAKILQVKGEVAELTGMGYGYGVVVHTIDTQQSVAPEPVRKESERLEIIDSNGKPTAIITDDYVTGETITLTDTASTLVLKALIEGGEYATAAGYTNKKYTSPDANSVKPTFTLDWFTSLYLKDDNQQSSVVGYRQYRCKSCKGQVGGMTGDRNIQAQVYTINATGYRDPLTNAKYPHKETWDLTKSEYDALNLKNI